MSGLVGSVLETDTLSEGSSNISVGYISKSTRGTSINISFIARKDIGMTIISVYVRFISPSLEELIIKRYESIPKCSEDGI
jgi:hypothetical protein